MRGECLAAGYAIAVPYSVPQSGFFSERVPARLVTATWFMPDASLLPGSGLDEGERTHTMNRLGVPLALVPAMTDTMETAVDSGDYVSSVFTSLAAALDVKSAFLDTLDVRAVGLGLPAELVTDYLARWLDVSERSGDRWYGTLSCLRKRQPLAPGGADVRQRLGVEINEVGLIDDERLAVASAELIEREEWADQGSWDPWLLVSY